MKLTKIVLAVVVTFFTVTLVSIYVRKFRVLYSGKKNKIILHFGLSSRAQKAAKNRVIALEEEIKKMREETRTLRELIL